MTGSIIVSSLLLGFRNCYRDNNPPTTKQSTHPPRHACKACDTGLQTEPCMYFNTQTVTLKQTNRSTKHSHVNTVKHADQQTLPCIQTIQDRHRPYIHSCTDSKTQRHPKPHSDKHSHSYRQKSMKTQAIHVCVDNEAHSHNT